MRLAGGVIPPHIPPWAGPQERELVPSKEGQGSLPAAPASLRSLLHHMRPRELGPHPQSLVNHRLPTVYRLNARLRAPHSVWRQQMLCHRPQEALQGSASAGTAKSPRGRKAWGQSLCLYFTWAWTGCPVLWPPHSLCPGPWASSPRCLRCVPRAWACSGPVPSTLRRKLGRDQHKTSSRSVSTSPSP